MLVSTPTSAPGRIATAETEAEIASTQDDYGTSYYYRGNVENNYVNYSGMCWRIVRVQGDGTIKLALADENGTCDASSYSTSNESAFINDSSIYNYASWNDNVSYLVFETSIVKNILNKWASDNLDTSKLVDAEWCNDTAKTSISGDTSYYGAYDRLYPISTATPTLKCNTTGMEGTEGIEAKAQKYIGKIALLTADEIVFAGATSSSSLLNYSYLTTNALLHDHDESYGSYGYWTMSPYSKEQEYVFIFTMAAKLNYIIPADGYSLPVRPAVVLQSNVTIASSGNGTMDNPYVFNYGQF